MNEPNVITEPGKSLVHRVTNTANASATTGTSIMKFNEVVHLLSNKPLRGGNRAHIDDTCEEIEEDIAAARAAMAGSPKSIPYAEVRRRLELE